MDIFNYGGDAQQDLAEKIMGQVLEVTTTTDLSEPKTLKFDLEGVLTPLSYKTDFPMRLFLHKSS